MTKSLLLATAAALAWSAQLRAQAPDALASAIYGDSRLSRQPRVKSCSTDTTRSGPLRGEGVGLVVVDSAGRPVLSTLEIIETRGVSVPAVASVAVRALPHCTFESGRTRAGPVAAWTAFKISTGRTGKAVITRQRVPSPRPAALVPAERRVIDRSIVYSQRDSLIDEQPRLIKCHESPGSGGFTQTYRPTAEEFFSGIHEGDGSAEVSYIVKPNGLIDQGSLEIIRTDNWNLANAYLARVAACEFAPARIDGEPIAIRMVTRINRHARSIM